MDSEFWLTRWEKNEIGFHKTEPHHYLLRFFSLLQTQPGDIIFVPLCGKSQDLIWLREQELNVVGIELSRTAVEDFFSENDLTGEWREEAERSCCYAQGYKLICGDFFKLSVVDLDGAHSVYDRASLVAFPPEMRSRYAAHLAALLPAGSRVLLVSYDYNQSETHGPPFSVDRAEIDVLFSGDFQIDLLVEEDVLWSHRGLADRGVTQLRELVMLLVRN